MVDNIYVPLSSGPGPNPLADPHQGTASDDHHAELPYKAPNRLANIAIVVAVLGVILVWALQTSLPVIGFAVCLAAIVIASIALVSKGKRRSNAVVAIVIAALPFVFTVARLLFQF